MRTLTSVFSILALTFALGCSGGDDDDGGGTADASTAPDSGVVIQPDAMAATSADGTACTASEEDPQGGCPANSHACVGGNCMELCNLTAEMEPDGMACTAYEGPGASACIFGLSANGMPPFAAAACGIFCGDTTGNVPSCQGGACDGTCPNDFTCQESGTAGIKICQ